MNGKGSKRRPSQVSQSELARRWEQVFGGSKEGGGVMEETKEPSELTARRIVYWAVMSNVAIEAISSRQDRPIILTDEECKSIAADYPVHWKDVRRAFGGWK